MAIYGTKYRAGWASPNNLQGYLYIDQIDYIDVVKYGYLYNWYAVTNASPICAANAHVPTHTEMNALQSIISGFESEFNFKFAGLRLPGPNFEYLDIHGYLWTNTSYSTGDAYDLVIRVPYEVSYEENLKTSGNSVRLIIDTPIEIDGTHSIYVGNDGRRYNCVLIDSVWWTAENLAETKYQDGSLIPIVTVDAAWAALETGAICAYNNDANNILDTPAPIEDVRLSANSMVVSYAFADWNNPIIGMQCEFAIVNDKDDFYELLPLLTAEEREYRIRVVVIHPTAYTLFEGFLNCDTVTQKYLHRQSIKFVASSYLSKLEGFHPVSIDTLQNMTFINVIDEILRSTGTECNIRVNSKLRAEGDILGVGQTLFNKNGFYTELFWEDEVERTSSLDILKAILTSFDCYIYWWRGDWYIERYEDIWSESVDFVEYVSGHSYLPMDAGLDSGGSDDSDAVVTIAQVITDVHALKFINQSQTLSVIPGLKTIKINLEDKRSNNLVLSSLKDASITNTEVPQPAYRSFLIWEETNMTWEDYGLPKSSIVNAIRRQVTSAKPSYRGLYTTFKVTVDKEDIAINIKFKYFIDMAATITGWTKKWADYKFDFYWYLRIAGTDFYLVQSGEDWGTSQGLNTGIINNPDNTQEYQMQVVNIDGSSFDANTKTVEVSISVPLGAVKTYFGTLGSSNFTGLLAGEQEFVFGLGLERIHTPTGESSDGDQVDDCYIGDINITSTGGLQDNVIEAKVLTAKFLNVKDISLRLYDMDSYNYKNGVLRGDTLLIRTERWGTIGGLANIIRKGICWGISANPTTADSTTEVGTGNNAFVSTMTGLTPNTTYHVRAYIETDLGIIYGDDKSFTTANLLLGAHYQGGIIFYFLQPGDEGYEAGKNKGLIAALVDQGKPTFWASIAGGASAVPGTRYEIGYGKANSNLMTADYKTAPYAVASCEDYIGDGFDDWYLPSRNELLQMYKQRALIGGFKASWYWSSTQAGQGFALAMDFGNYRGWNYASDEDRFYWGVWEKHNYINVRAIRSFTEA